MDKTCAVQIRYSAFTSCWKPWRDCYARSRVRTAACITLVLLWSPQSSINCCNFRQTPSVQSTPSGNNNMAMIAFRCRLSRINLTLIRSQLEVKLDPTGQLREKIGCKRVRRVWLGDQCHWPTRPPSQFNPIRCHWEPTASHPLCQPLRPTYCQPPAKASRASSKKQPFPFPILPGMVSLRDLFRPNFLQGGNISGRSCDL